MYKVYKGGISFRGLNTFCLNLFTALNRYFRNLFRTLKICIKKKSVISARETFVVNQLSVGHEVEYGKKNGDFVIDRRYTFEVGDPDKTFKQIANVPDSYILADNLEYASGNKLPLWMVGLKLCKNPSRISMIFLRTFISIRISLFPFSGND